MVNLPRIDSSVFDWLTWRNGTICDMFGIQQFEPAIVSSTAKDVLRKYAIGYCPADQLPCRPKDNYMAVMFSADDGNKIFWTHMTQEEFIAVFCEE